MREKWGGVGWACAVGRHEGEEPARGPDGGPDGETSTSWGPGEAVVISRRGETVEFPGMQQEDGASSGPVPWKE